METDMQATATGDALALARLAAFDWAEACAKLDEAIGELQKAQDELTAARCGIAVARLEGHD
jgi:hypothetical protein